jgi:3-oxoacyl-[acyl-carrier protein] reductase
MSFSGKVALVAGAGGGMGLAIARDLMAAGAEVGLADLKAAPEDLSGGNLYHQGDLTDPAFVAQAVEETVARFGRLDYLVNTTGVLWFDRDTSFAAMDLAVWDQVLAINLKSFVLTSRFAVPEMKKAGGGAIVHFSSIDALSGDSKPQDAYGAAKAAVIRLSKSIAVQFAGDNIRSNVILPGGTLSPMQARWEDDLEAATQAASHVPLGRLGRPEDMSAACLFLLSDQASYITGTELIVDGGVTALP